MIVGLLCVQLILVGVILYREVIQRQLCNLATGIFYALYAIMYVIVPLILQLFFGGARNVVVGDFNYFADPFIYYLFNLYGISLLLATLFFGSRAGGGPVRESPVQPERPAFNQEWYIGALIIGGVIIFIKATGMSLSELLIASRFAWFGAAGFNIVWLTVASYFIALVGIYAFLVRVNPKRNVLVLSAVLAAVVLHGVITKDRKWILFLASGFIAGQYELAGRRLIITKRALLVFSLLFVIMLVSQFIRDVAFRLALGEQISVLEEWQRWQSFLFVYGDISYFYRASLEAIHQVVNYDFSVPLGTLRRIVFFYLPKGWSFGLKPEDISATFSDVVNGGDAQRRGNMPPGLFGLFVISFGWIGSIFIIPWLAWLLRKLDEMFRYGHGPLRRATLSLYLFAALLAFRGDESSAFYYVMSTWLFILVGNAVAVLWSRSPLDYSPASIGSASR